MEEILERQLLIQCLALATFSTVGKDLTGRALCRSDKGSGAFVYNPFKDLLK